MIQVSSEQSLGCFPIDEKVDIPREIDPLYSDENIKQEYFNFEEEMVDNDKVGCIMHYSIKLLGGAILYIMQYTLIMGTSNL